MGHVYTAVGSCIYCGETKLSPGRLRFGKEHIIPLALGGNLVLPEASCTTCESIINSQIETPILSQEWGDLRNRRKFPHRKKHRKKHPRKTNIPVQDVGGNPLEIPVEEHSTPVPLYKFKQPRILTGDPRNDDSHWEWEMLASHDEEMAMQRKYPEWNKTHRFKAQPYPFARLLAKIAYGYSFAEYGIAGFTPLGLDIILGRSDDCFYTVGGTFDIAPPIPGGGHVTKIGILCTDPDRAMLTVDIRLFSQIATPPYLVVAGEIDLKNREHVSVFSQHCASGKIINSPLAMR